jgi:hypothetical protein
MSRHTLAALACAFLLTAPDASAQLLRRRAATVYCPTYTPYCPPPAPVVGTTPTASALTADEEGMLYEMLAGGWIKPGQVEGYKAATAEERTESFKEFRASLTPQPTAEELGWWLEMVEAGKKNGGFDADELPAYQKATPEERKQAYQQFSAFAPAPTKEELKQWLAMVKAGKDKGGHAADDLPKFLKAKPAERAEMYKKFEAAQKSATGG